MSPQYLPSQDSVGAHEAGTHSPLAPQSWPAGQVAGQCRRWPQPSPTSPQYWPLPTVQELLTVQVAGSGPHTCGVTAPQIWPAGQVAGQLSLRPQPSPMSPQYWVPLPASHEPAVQLEPWAQTLGMPPPPHTWS